MNNSERTLRSLFSEDGYDYIYIPRIQRDYAQGRDDEEAKVIRENILDDVADCKPLSWGIIFGVSDMKNRLDDSVSKCFIPIDGQQRLTTLYLLHLYADKFHDIKFDYLNCFNYETRNTSTDFVETLVKNLSRCELGKSSLKEHIINQGWFLQYWALDPTVDAMLNMLTSIHERFNNRPEVFEYLDRVTFEFLDLKNLELNETLYLKMNSRGRKLSQFDKIKSEIDKILPTDCISEDDCCFNIYGDEHLATLSRFDEKWRYCIDRKWSDLFWDRQSHSFDIRLLAFIINFLIAKAGKAYQFSDKLLEIDFTRHDFYLPWKYLKSYLSDGDKAIEFFYQLSAILNKLVAQVSTTPLIKRLLNLPANYTDRAKIFGLLCFEGTDFNSASFKEWERFVNNYATNTVGDKETFFAFSKRISDEFAAHSCDILTYLSEKFKSEKYDRTQLNEEYFKAAIILKGGTVAQIIRRAELHPMLNGRLRPLIVDGDRYETDSIAKIWENFIRHFGKDGNALAFVNDDTESLSRRVAFATAFTKSITQMNQLFDEIKCLNFVGSDLKEKLRRQRFEPIFRRCLLCDDLTELDELQWNNSVDIEGIQTKAALLQEGVIEGVLKKTGGDGLRFRWYHNCSCFYPYNTRTNDWRIGFDRISKDPFWTRNRNHVLKYLENAGFKVSSPRVSDNPDVALWWGGDIKFSNESYPEVCLMWDAYYNIGLIDHGNGCWVKRKIKSETENENYLFNAVGKDAHCIEEQILKLISDFYK